jgi:hypothetical protein
MRTQTKCTWSLVGLIIVEILPIPFTAIYSLFVIRKRSPWVPGVVERLYADKEWPEGKIVDKPIKEAHNPMVTRRMCTISLTVMFLIDVIVPFTVPFGIYIVRRRPAWFKNVVARLYSDQPGENADTEDSSEPVENDPAYDKVMEQKHIELQQRNFDFAKSMRVKAK